AAAPVEKIRGCHLERRKFRMGFADMHETTGIAVGERVEQHLVNHAEQSGIDADAERDRQYGCDGERRRAKEGTAGIAEILGEHGDESNVESDARFAAYSRHELADLLDYVRADLGCAGYRLVRIRNSVSCAPSGVAPVGISRWR